MAVRSDPPPLPVYALQAHYVWAHLVSDAGASGQGERSPGQGERNPGAGGPMLEAAEWHVCLARWLRTAAHSRLVSLDGRSVLYGVKLSHPSRRSHQLDPWDTVHLLAFFGVSRTEDVPSARARTLDAIPVASIWGNLGSPTGDGGGGGVGGVTTTAATSG
ncbi:hypothetical protein T492DRAFT_833793 [Pavlovales sp. CCMP2436]|nr:hypothetical protein T492DRAFT_833793 [Pavlovales sp. CCMP2436]